MLPFALITPILIGSSLSRNQFGEGENEALLIEDYEVLQSKTELCVQTLCQRAMTLYA